MNLRWTDAGRAALAGAAHVGVAAVKLTHLAIGDGQGAGGAADDSLAALRNERHRAELSGESATDKIAARADFAPDATYGITEAGVFGTAGSAKTPALYLYWSDSGKEAGKAADGTALAIAAVIEFPDAPADVTVTVGGTMKFGNVDPATESAFGSTRYATAAETGDGTAADRSVTPKGLRSAAGSVAAALFSGTVADGTVYQLKGDSDGKLVVEKRKLPAASTTQKGLVELATGDEAKKGTDDKRAVTPKALKAATDALNVPAAPATASTTQKGIVELATGDEAKKGTDGDKAVTPKALKAATDALNVPAAPASASTTAKGIVELATGDETGKGTDAARAVTPKGLAVALPKAVSNLLAGAPEAGKKYVLEGVAGGGVKVVAAPFELFSYTFSGSWGSSSGPVTLLDLSTIPGLPSAGDWIPYVEMDVTAQRGGVSGAIVYMKSSRFSSNSLANGAMGAIIGNSRVYRFIGGKPRAVAGWTAAAPQALTLPADANHDLRAYSYRPGGGRHAYGFTYTARITLIRVDQLPSA